MMSELTNEEVAIIIGCISHCESDIAEGCAAAARLGEDEASLHEWFSKIRALREKLAPTSNAKAA